MEVQQTNWVPRQQSNSGKRRNKWNKWIGSGVALILLAVAAQEVATRLSATHAVTHSIPAPPVVTVSAPLARNLDTRRQFLGQFSAVQSVELRAQVGGTLTQIGFKDGDIVHTGDLLFEIDPTPYQIKLNEGIAQLESANARLNSIVPVN
jgi:multidrug efflux pump subunit AcrA (membrane-fusion protein)